MSARYLRPLLLAATLSACATPKPTSCGAGHEDIAKQVAADREHLKQVQREAREREERYRIYSGIWECMESKDSKGATP